MPEVENQYQLRPDLQEELQLLLKSFYSGSSSNHQFLKPQILISFLICQDFFKIFCCSAFSAGFTFPGLHPGFPL